jgi:hypothetical protein
LFCHQLTISAWIATLPSFQTSPEHIAFRPFEGATLGQVCEVLVHGYWPLRKSRLPIKNTVSGDLVVEAVLGSTSHIASDGLLVEADHISCWVAKPGGNLGRIRADGLHDLTSTRGDRVNRRGYAVDHDVKQKAGF